MARYTVVLYSHISHRTMKVEVHLVRRSGIKIPDREVSGVLPLVGDLMLHEERVSANRTLPTLSLTASGVTNGAGLLAVLYEPRIIMLGNNWMRFSGYELIRRGDEKQLVVQDWRCYVL